MERRREGIYLEMISHWSLPCQYDVVGELEAPTPVQVRVAELCREAYASPELHQESMRELREIASDESKSGADRASAAILAFLISSKKSDMDVTTPLVEDARPSDLFSLMCANIIYSDAMGDTLESLAVLDIARGKMDLVLGRDSTSLRATDLLEIASLIVVIAASTRVVLSETMEKVVSASKRLGCERILHPHKLALESIYPTGEGDLVPLAASELVSAYNAEVGADEGAHIKDVDCLYEKKRWEGPNTWLIGTLLFSLARAYYVKGALSHSGMFFVYACEVFESEECSDARRACAARVSVARVSMSMAYSVRARDSGGAETMSPELSQCLGMSKHFYGSALAGLHFPSILKASALFQLGLAMDVARDPIDERIQVFQEAHANAVEVLGKKSLLAASIRTPLASVTMDKAKRLGEDSDQGNQLARAAYEMATSAFCHAMRRKKRIPISRERIMLAVGSIDTILAGHRFSIPTAEDTAVEFLDIIIDNIRSAPDEIASRIYGDAREGLEVILSTYGREDMMHRVCAALDYLSNPQDSAEVRETPPVRA